MEGDILHPPAQPGSVQRSPRPRARPPCLPCPWLRVGGWPKLMCVNVLAYVREARLT